MTVRTATSLESSFEEASSRGGVVEQWYRIAGRVVALRAAGPAIIDRLTPAITHLRVEPADAELTVSMWDSASTSSPPPPLPEVDPDEVPGAFYFHQRDNLRVSYQPGLGAMNALAADNGEAWYWVRAAGELPFWERAAPMRQVLHWWLADHGVQQVHAGAVGNAEGGVLLVGRPGSGKSTSSLASLVGGLCFAGDDYVAVSTDGEPWVHSLYCSGKLERVHTRRFPGLNGAVANGEEVDDEKTLFFVHDSWPDRTVDGFPLRAIMLPTVVAERPETRVVDVPKLAALAALAPSTIIQLHATDAEALTRMRDLVERLPCHRLELGADVDAIAPAIRRFLDGEP